MISRMKTKKTVFNRQNFQNGNWSREKMSGKEEGV